MLHPNQFQVNEAWIAFQLNDLPIPIESDGDFNCLTLMDAASCFILGSAYVPASEAEPSQLDARQLLKTGQAHKNELPKRLFIPTEQPADNLVVEAERQNIAVVRVPEEQLAIFIVETRELFKESLLETEHDS